jgi:hypothetical protein
MSEKRPILGVDPGLEQSGFVLWDGNKIIESGVIDNEQLRAKIETTPDSTHIVCEMIASYGMAVGRSVFETCVWIGRFMEAALRRNLDWKCLFRQEIKIHLCHSAKAKDSNIRQALIDRFGEPGTKKNPGPLFGVKSHAWAALAVAVTFCDFKYATSIYPPE